MADRRDGSAGDADYGQIGAGYRRYRQPNPRISAEIVEALGDARTVLNVGAGAGSYEPADRSVTAGEPSATMRAQRPSSRPEAVDAVAERLPFRDDTFDAAMATFTIHQWPNLLAGLSEAARSRIELLDELQAAEFDRDVGPGVYDIHSPRVPATQELVDLLERAIAVVGPEHLWVNPDCGLKTRGYAETEQALEHLVAAADHLRRQSAR